MRFFFIGILWLTTAAIAVADAPPLTPRPALRLRAAPVIASDNVIKKFAGGESLTEIERQGEWCKVREHSSGLEGWVACAYLVAPDGPSPEAPTNMYMPPAASNFNVVARVGPCKIRKGLRNLNGYDRYELQAWAPTDTGSEVAVSPLYSISASGLLRRDQPDSEEYSRFVSFVRSQAQISGACGAGAVRDPYDPVPTIQVIEAPNTVARVGPCAIRQATRSDAGFDETVWQAWAPIAHVGEQAASNLYTINASNILRRDQPTAGELWLLFEFVQREAQLSGLCGRQD